MFENKKILILGFARSGYEAAKVLIGKNNQVIINDAKTENNHDYKKVEELRDLGVKFVFGHHPDDLLDNTFNYLIKNPGVPTDHLYVKKANSLKIEVINEAEMAYRIFKGKVKLIGITGTNGKTTTTTLIYEVLKAANLPVHLAGNIGIPLCSLLNTIKTNDIIVMEISSQQLENFKEFKPDISVMTNLFPAHIDFFKTYDNYKKIKSKIFQNQTGQDTAILNYDNSDVIKLFPKIKAKVNYFSTDKDYADCYLEDTTIYYNKQKIITTDEIKVLGRHNYENTMAMILAVKEFNVNNEIIVDVLKNFKGVPHRLEYVKELNTRTFYNDSKATNIEATKIALSSFNQPVILIMGGMERNQDFNDLNENMKNVRLVVCYGENKNRIKEWLDKIGIYSYVCNTIIEATNIAYEKSRNNEIILLSPSSASWDQFDSFESRGDLYKKTLKKLK